MFYNTHTDVPWDLQKFEILNFLAAFYLLIANRYYQQRHQIFSKYDEGIWMTEDSWFGVTPEPVAMYYSRFKQTQVFNNHLQAK
jgi:trimethylguanosine synthase